MPRFFFNIVDGVELQDPEGSEHPDLQSALHEARLTARGILAEGMRGGLDRRNWSVQILGEEGELLAIVPFVETIERDDASLKPSKKASGHTGPAQLSARAPGHRHGGPSSS